MPPTYSLTELADAAGVTVRTVRYYIAQGLLPSPGAGPSARYSEGHVLRLRLIKQLQVQHLPLAEIRQRLATLSDEEVRVLLEERAAPAGGSAMDYIRGVLGGSGQGPAFALAMAPQRAVMLARRSTAAPTPEPPALAEAPPAYSKEADASVRPPDRSQWDRVELAPDVELHVRRPLSRIQNKRVERLISIAREVLREDQP